MSIPVVGTDDPEVMADYYGMSVKEMTAAGVFYMSGYSGSDIAQVFGMDRASCEVTWPPTEPLAVAEGDEEPVDDDAGDGGGSADDPAVDG